MVEMQWHIIHVASLTEATTIFIKFKFNNMTNHFSPTLLFQNNYSRDIAKRLTFILVISLLNIILTMLFRYSGLEFWVVLWEWNTIYGVFTIGIVITCRNNNYVVIIPMSRRISIWNIRRNFRKYIFITSGRVILLQRRRYKHNSTRWKPDRRRYPPYFSDSNPYCEGNEYVKEATQISFGSRVL